MLYRILSPLIAALVLPTLFVPAQAESDDPYGDKKLCAPYAKTPFPSGDGPTAEEAQALKGCQSADLYYGAPDGKPDYVKARKCAYLEYAKPRSGPNIGYGADILMMIYANGLGVNRDYKLSARLACESSWAPAEVMGRLEHLTVMRQTAAGKSITVPDGMDPKHIDTCDDLTSGATIGSCTEMQAAIRKSQEDYQQDQRAKNWTESQKAAFKTLKDRAEAFAAKHAESEIMLDGTIWEADLVSEREKTLDAFKSGLSLMEKGASLPHQHSLAEDDARLNAIYREMLPKKFYSAPMSHTDTSAATIKETQRLWLKYRDAYVAFAADLYPQRSADEIKAWLTELRIHDLESLPLDDGQ